MKKIYLLAATMFLAATTFAQYDIEVTLDSPASGSDQAPSASQEVTFTITNNGPDAIPADTLWLAGMWMDMDAQNGGYFALDDGTPNGVNGLILPQPIPAGQSVTSADLAPVLGSTITFNTSTYADGVLVGVTVIGIAGDPNDIPQTGDPNDADNSNNADFFVINSASSSIAVNEKNVNVFPNPANDFVTFQIDGLENGNVVISSITGQEVVNTSVNGLAKVDVSALNNGVYIYKITNSNGELIKTSKLVIQK